MDPWAPMDPRALWTLGPLDLGAQGTQGGPMGPWAHGPMVVEKGSSISHVGVSFVLIEFLTDKNQILCPKMSRTEDLFVFFVIVLCIHGSETLLTFLFYKLIITLSP